MTLQSSNRSIYAHFSNCGPIKILFTFLAAILIFSQPLQAEKNPRLSIEQITFGEQHHFFGYIGQAKTIPWNASGRYIAAMRSDFHDHMPSPAEAADIILLDAHNDYKVIKVDETCGWNFQQGAMLYWNPIAPETQFFFNDRDPETNQTYTVLFDIEKNQRVQEYKYPNMSLANSGVAQNGNYFLAINYGRLSRLRPVTGYPGAFDQTSGVLAPENDGVFLIDVKSSEKRLLVSYKQLAELAQSYSFRKSKNGRHSALPPGNPENIETADPRISKAAFYINHTLWNRNDDCIYLYLRGRYGDQSIWIDMPCTIKPDGSELVAHTTLLGGHPEWAEDNLIISENNKRQVLYDVRKQMIIGQLGSQDIFPKPGGDISLSIDGRWFANGYSDAGDNFYVIYNRHTGLTLTSVPFSRGPHVSGELRIDPAPRWNRDNNALLVPGWTDNGTRQMFIIHIQR